jgi:hypothetical protein
MTPFLHPSSCAHLSQKPTIPVTKKAFKITAQALGERRTGSSRRNRQRNSPATHMRWNDEIASGRRSNTIDENLASLRLGADRLVDGRVVRSRDRETRAREVASSVPSSRPPDPIGSRQPADSRAGFGADDGYSRIGGKKTADFPRGDTSRTDDDNGLVCEIEK